MLNPVLFSLGSLENEGEDGSWLEGAAESEIFLSVSFDCSLRSGLISAATEEFCAGRFTTG